MLPPDGGETLSGSKRDYYEVSVFPGSGPDDPEEGVPPSSPFQYTPTGIARTVRGGAVKEINEATRSCPTRKNGSSTTLRGNAGPTGQGFGGFGDFSGFSASRTSSTTFFGGNLRGGGGGTPAPARRGSPVQPHGPSRRRVFRRPRRRIVRPRDGARCHDCSGTGGERGPGPRVRACRRQARSRWQQGFFSIRRTCGRCGGRPGVKGAVRKLRRTGHVRESRTRSR